MQIDKNATDIFQNEPKPIIIVILFAMIFAIDLDLYISCIEDCYIKNVYHIRDVFPCLTCIVHLRQPTDLLRNSHPVWLVRKKLERELLEKAVNVATVYICAFLKKCVKSVDLLMCLSCH